jgi:hypothetical protein
MVSLFILGRKRAMAAECDSLSGNWSTSRRYDGEMTKLALLDGHSLAYRAFYA